MTTTYSAHTTTEAFADVTKEQISAAFARGDCRIIYGRALHHTTSRLSIAGEDWDTRGQCYQMAEESWTAECKSLHQAYAVARTS